MIVRFWFFLSYLITTVQTDKLDYLKKNHHQIIFVFASINTKKVWKAELNKKSAFFYDSFRLNASVTSWSQGIRRPERSSLPFVMTSKRLPTAGGRAYFCGLIFSSSLYSTTYHLFCIKWGVLCGLRTGRRPSHSFIKSSCCCSYHHVCLYVM